MWGDKVSIFESILQHQLMKLIYYNRSLKYKDSARILDTDCIKLWYLSDLTREFSIFNDGSRDCNDFSSFSLSPDLIFQVWGEINELR